MVKRNIAAIALPDVEFSPIPTPPPEATKIDPRELIIDEAYQRNLSDRSIALIRRIAANWDWRRFKAPNVAWTDDGLEVTDGQHTAIAAACRPDIAEITVLITEAAGQSDRAAAFIGINRDRVAITAPQLHAAAIAAGDADALAIEQACAAAGIAVLKSQPGAGRFKPRQTMAVAAIGAIVRRSPETARQALQVLAETDLAPIQANHIKAVEMLLTDDQFSTLDTSGLGKSIASMGEGGDQTAKVFAATHNVPLWKALASVWFKKAPKLRRPVEPAPGAKAMLDDVKRDARPPTGRWQSGRYMRRCQDCDGRFEGAVNSTQCADCAYSGKDRS